jgi:hypothetical protein
MLFQYVACQVGLVCCGPGPCAKAVPVIAKAMTTLARRENRFNMLHLLGLV